MDEDHSSTTTVEPLGQMSLDVVQRIAQLMRLVRESMHELGLDQAVKDAAHAIPDARDRLRYVGRMTEQAANKVLTAAEETGPLQEQLSAGSQNLGQRWQQWFDAPAELPVARELVDDTRDFLDLVGRHSKSTQENLMEIIMAQDFQDLTGQVIQGMLKVIGTIETELVQVLIDSVPPEKREETAGLLNGPVIDTAAADVVTDQDQVDDLLSSLGF
ncbi:protein phosphatase CheZ [Alcaligenaceae bacterium 429]|uniref:protein phosphatase CheZ n=1 Tax=Paenalcaligenes sp. Me52 TaxID=3392038 RepID=UPI001091B2C9|nr:protein phosphatase CheZ [Alcaligenaceae bacterium 429]